MIDLHNKYKTEVVPSLMKTFGYNNVMQTPRILKIVINRGVGEADDNKKAIEASIEEISVISGQKAIVRKAKKSIAGFKLREGMPVGVKVTLHGKRMYDFFNKFINICLPKIRDFRGISAKFDGNGNFTFGIREQIIFPEISYEKVDKIRGMDITIVTSASNNQEGKELLKLLGVPFRS